MEGEYLLAEPKNLGEKILAVTYFSHFRPFPLNLPLVSYCRFVRRLKKMLGDIFFVLRGRVVAEDRSVSRKIVVRKFWP